MKRPKTTGIQYAALPFRTRGRRLEILLITSRETRRWVIPKGWPMEGLGPAEAAAIEGVEEAGILGEIDQRPIGSYRYLKTIGAQPRAAVQVIVFPFTVHDHAETWKEQGQREQRWFTYKRAAALVAEPSLRRLILEFGKTRSPSLLHALRAVVPLSGEPRFPLSFLR
jgi:8-oxo-dGTP pyrophosphatase MutT (NUDIX family)